MTHTMNLEAYLGYMVGEIVASSCNYCTRGYGAFENCVVVKDQEGKAYLYRACMSCHHSSEGTRCSFRGKYTTEQNRRPQLTITGRSSRHPDTRRNGAANTNPAARIAPTWTQKVQSVCQSQYTSQPKRPQQANAYPPVSQNAL